MSEWRVGDYAEHRYKELDPRRVVEVDDLNRTLYIDILGTKVGPVPQRNYERLPGPA